MAIDVDNLRDRFRRNYEREARLFRAPGRVNLIGEHTDYNDGFVLPTAIDRECVAAANVRADSLVKVRALDVNQQAEFDLQGEPIRRRGTWLDFVEGVVRMLGEKFPIKRGADIAFTSSVPVGAGLSSSAAIEIAIGFAILSLNEIQVDRTALALAAQRAEHEFVGAKIGIMDQLTSANGRAGHALLIDCRSLKFTEIPLNFSDVAVVVCDSGVKHDLAASEYNRRREECEAGVEILQKQLPSILALRDVLPGDFELHEDSLPDVVKRRCRHVITEIERTLAAAELLKSGNAAEFGQLMYQSHRSLRDDYQVSAVELDFLVETASLTVGVYGARMTGGGFGGCTVNLVQRDAVGEFQATISRAYERQFGFAPKIYPVKPSDGAGEVF